MIKIKKILLISFLSVVSVICLFSLAVSVYYTTLTNIDKKILRQGKFNITNTQLKLLVEGLRNSEYNVILRCYYPRPRTESFDEFRARTIADRSNFIAEIALLDSHGVVLERETLQPNSHRTKTWGADFFELYLFDFDGLRSQKYTITIMFKSPDAYFDELNKEIIVEEKYDYAALPWWKLISVVFFIVFAITFIILLISGMIIWRRKRRAAGSLK